MPHLVQILLPVYDNAGQRFPTDQIVVRDAVCSSSDEGHDALVTLFRQRYTEQIEVADAAAIMERWES